MLLALNHKLVRKSDTGASMRLQDVSVYLQRETLSTFWMIERLGSHA